MRNMKNSIMDRINFKNTLRWMIIHYISLGILIFLFYKPGFAVVKKYTLLLYLLPLVPLIISFREVYWKTGFWVLTHKTRLPQDKDQLKRYYIVSRESYVVFTIAVIILLFLFSVTGIQIDVFMSASILYLAHILPASLMVLNKNYVS
jgi:hypothetical protein